MATIDDTAAQRVSSAVGQANFAKSLLLPVSDGAPNGVIYEENGNRTSDRHEQTVQVHTAHSAVSDKAEHPSSNDRTCNTETDIEQ